jgi:hypothetical protein
MTVNHILDQIDQAIGDNLVSRDAMRWTPDKASLRFPHFSVPDDGSSPEYSTHLRTVIQAFSQAFFDFIEVMRAGGRRVGQPIPDRHALRMAMWWRKSRQHEL